MSKSDGANLPPNWIVAKLPQIAALNPPLDRCFLNDQTPVTFVPMSAVDEEHRGLNRPQTRPLAKVKKGYTNFITGDVLFAKITPCMENGKICVVPPLPNDVGYGSTEFHVLRPNAGITAAWISHFMAQVSFRRLARSRMGGSAGQMRVPTFFLEEVEIPVPPTAEQTRILDKLDELFSDLDKGVALLERTRRNLDRYRASVLKAAVEGRLSAAWREKNRGVEPASDLLKRILSERRKRWEQDQLAKFKAAKKQPPKDWKERYEEPVAPDISGLPQLPESWCWTSVDQLAHYVRNGWSLKPNPQPPGIPILRINAVRPMKVAFDDLRYVSRSESEVRSFFVQPGDVLFTRYNGSIDLLGVGGLVRDVPQPTLHPDKLICVRTAIDTPLPEFLEVACNVGASRRHMTSRARTTAGQTGISGLDVKEMPIPLCPLAEQEQIVSAVDSMLMTVRALIKSVSANQMKAAALRQSLLRRAFAGKLVPQHSKDSPVQILKADESALTAASKGNPTTARGRRSKSSRNAPTLWPAIKK